MYGENGQESKLNISVATTARSQVGALLKLSLQRLPDLCRSAPRECAGADIQETAQILPKDSETN